MWDVRWCLRSFFHLAGYMHVYLAGVQGWLFTGSKLGVALNLHTFHMYLSLSVRDSGAFMSRHSRLSRFYAANKGTCFRNGIRQEDAVSELYPNSSNS